MNGTLSLKVLHSQISQDLTYMDSLFCYECSNLRAGSCSSDGLLAWIPLSTRKLKLQCLELSGKPLMVFVMAAQWPSVTGRSCSEDMSYNLKVQRGIKAVHFWQLKMTLNTPLANVNDTKKNLPLSWDKFLSTCTEKEKPLGVIQRQDCWVRIVSAPWKICRWLHMLT